MDSSNDFADESTSSAKRSRAREIAIERMRLRRDSAAAASASTSSTPNNLSLKRQDSTDGINAPRASSKDRRADLQRLRSACK